MTDYIIKVENLGKKYKIRHQQDQQRYVALRDVIAKKRRRRYAGFLAKRQRSEIRDQTGLAFRLPTSDLRTLPCDL